LRAPDYRRGSNKYRTLSTGVYDWRKELEAIYITESAGGTESNVDRSDLCRIANSAGTITSYCGQELSYPASYTKDGSATTEWRHNTDVTHWINYDLGGGAKIGGAKIYWRGLDSGFKCDVETNDDLSSWTTEIDDWNI